MWIDPETQRVFGTHSEIRSGFPNVSFPAVMSSDAIASVGLVALQRDAKPTVDVTQDVTLSAPALVDGAWVQGWTVTDAAPEVAAERKAARRQGMQLTFAQLMIGIVSAGWITEAEGDAWLSGTLPAPVLDVIASLPANQQFAAKARAVRPSVILRTDPLVAALASAQGKTDDDLDTFFLTFAQV